MLAAVGAPVVSAPTDIDRVVAPAARPAPAAVHVMASVVVPADPTHLQVAEVPVKVFTLVESTLVKYPLGTVKVT